MKKLAKQLIELGHEKPELRRHLRPVLAHLEKTSKTAKPIKLNDRDLHLLAEITAKASTNLKQSFGTGFFLSEEDPRVKDSWMTAYYIVKQTSGGKLELQVIVTSLMGDVYEDVVVMEKTVKISAQDLDDAPSHTDEDLVKMFLPDVLSALNDVRSEIVAKLPDLYKKERDRLGKEAVAQMKKVEKIVKKLGLEILDRSKDADEVEIIVGMGDYDGEPYQAARDLRSKVKDLASIRDISRDKEHRWSIYVWW